MNMEDTIMRFIHCPYCGDKLIQKEIGDEGEIPYCQKCEVPIIDLPYTCTITLVVNELQEVALIKQDYVSTTNYVCVAGYIKSGESAEETAAREVFEELGIPVERVTYMKSYYYERKDMLMLGFIADVRKMEFHISGEVDKAAWFTYEEALTKLKEGSIAMQLLKDYIG
jgi:NAD+ diphosphatase